MATGSVYSYPTAYTTSGSISGTKYQNAVGKGADTSAASGNDYASGGSSSKAYIYYSFEFDEIPENATIDSVSCIVKGHLENTRRSTANVQLYVGTSTAKGSESKFTSTSAQTLTLTTGSWTRNEIDDMRLRFEIGYYGGLINGATVTINYSWNDVTHIVTVTGENATPSGENTVSEGASFTVKINQSDKPKVTDNGSDVSDSLVQKQDSPESYSVENITTTYGFELNGNGYYESNNAGHSNSAAVCKVNFHMPVSGTITFSVINYAESTYDFGLLSGIDETLSTNYSADSSNVYWSGLSHNSSSVQTVTYEMTAGDHFIYVKYFKDQYTDDNNDSLQFKVAISLSETPTYTPYWVYVISNVSRDHTVVVADAITDAIYIKVNGEWSTATKAYKKTNSVWVEQSDLVTVFDTNTKYVRGGI